MMIVVTLFFGPRSRTVRNAPDAQAPLELTVELRAITSDRRPRIKQGL